MNSTLRLLGRPLLHWWRNLKLRRKYKAIDTNPKAHIDSVFMYAFGRTVNWENPQDINEVIQWLKIYSDTSRWSLYADKYRVREYVKSCGLEDLLVPLYGKWDYAWQINWKELPEQFIMKVNNGSGDTKICTSKKDIDKLQWWSDFSVLLHHKIGYEMYEPQYSKMKPCIIAEQLLDYTKQSVSSSSLIDYKVWCFHGEPKYIWVITNRTKESCNQDMYDVFWNRKNGMCLYTSHYQCNSCVLPPPVNLLEMLNAAEKLSKNVPLARVDFYEVDGKLYFGEMTMTSAGGFMDFLTEEALIQMRNDFYRAKKNNNNNRN